MECLRKSRIPLLLAYGYLFLPFLLFAGGWLKWYVAAPVIAALLYVFYRMARGAPALWSPVWNRRAVWKLLAILCVIAVWVFFSGIGKFTFQNEDHNTRNVMFDMLVEGDWPLVYENPPAEYYGEPVAFTYYLGFWLPAALVGKAFGLAAGRVAQVVWAALGIAIFYSLVLANFVKKLIVWPLFLFIFFSGMDIVGRHPGAVDRVPALRGCALPSCCCTASSGTRRFITSRRPACWRSRCLRWGATWISA
jgi:membrane protein